MYTKLIFGTTMALLLTACGSVDPNLVTRPAGSKPFEGDRAELVSQGKELWNDTSLSSNGIACQDCHVKGAQFKEYFAQDYPHPVDMANSMADLESIDAEQMVQFCMIVPMKAEPLPWDSKELAALTAYIEDTEQPGFKARGE